MGNTGNNGWLNGVFPWETLISLDNVTSVSRVSVFPEDAGNIRSGKHKDLPGNKHLADLDKTFE